MATLKVKLIGNAYNVDQGLPTWGTRPPRGREGLAKWTPVVWIKNYAFSVKETPYQNGLF
jgi:hypothetical protein